MDATVEEAGERHTAPAAAAGEPVLAIEGVRKQWPGTAHPVLDGVGLSVVPGAVVAVTGRNGAGKTTLLRIAAGLILPDEGSVRIQGRDPERERTACQRRIGFLSAGNSGLYGRLRVEQHLDFWARLALLPRAQRRPAIESSLDRFALHELCGKRVDRLSMGQRQRLRVALALLHAPELVLLDEPLTSLDDEGAALLGAALTELVARGGAALICAPTGESALTYDVRYVVADGRVELA